MLCTRLFLDSCSYQWISNSEFAEQFDDYVVDCTASLNYQIYNKSGSLHTEKGLVQIRDKTAIKAQINDEQSLNRGSYSLLKYSNNCDVVSLKYRSNDGSILLLSNND